MTRTAILDASSKVTLSASSSLAGILRVVYLNRGLSINQDQSVTARWETVAHEWVSWYLVTLFLADSVTATSVVFGIPA